MSKDSLKFSIHNLILGDGMPEKGIFNSVPSELKVVSEDGASGIAKFDNNDQYLWMAVRTGKGLPRAAEVLNTKTKECELNPRKPEHAELRNQGYCLYCYDTGLLYVASGGEYFKKMLASLNPDIKVRNLYKTREEILSSAKRIDKVRLVSDEDLFSSNDTIFSVPNNALGLGNPCQVRVELKFPHVSATEKFKSFIREKGFCCCDRGSLSRLTVAGDFEEGDRIINSVFNLKSLEASISVSVGKDEGGLFNDDEVKSALLTVIE